jgi:putative tryptophan/tyrosine transport system substrate-binding protein
MKKAFVVLTLCGMLFTLCPSADAQQTVKISRIGILISGTSSDAAPRVRAFQQRLRELGYVEGKHITIEQRYAEGKVQIVPDLTNELIRLKPDVVVTDTSRATQAAKDATKTIPVVFTAANDPVGDGQVASLARPGGNLTGFSLLAPELNWKRLELLKDVFPKITRIGFLTRTGPDSPEAGLTTDKRFKESEADAKGLGLQLYLVGAKGADDLKNAFEEAKRIGIQALIAHPSTFLTTNRIRIIDLAANHRMPVIYPATVHAEAGGLMSYGVDVIENYRRAAVYVDKILQGIKPAELPVEQPTKFEFVINLKTAKQIGVTIPPNVLVRADKVIKEASAKAGGR